MRIFIDIGHPAHVHYFKNFIWQMKDKGHEFTITARKKEVIQYLLEYYKIPFESRGNGSNHLFGKFFYIFKADTLLLKKALKFKPDIFFSFASPYAAHAAWITAKPHIVLDDTENAVLNHKLYLPFSKVVLNPKSFKLNLGKKQLLFDSFIELSYLHPKYFKPNPQVIELLGLLGKEDYAIIRFVSWNANHDVGQRGLEYNMKIQLVNFLSKRMKVFISSESELPSELKKFLINIPPERLHDALAFARLYIGEGATTASECAMLGTPAIYVNSLSAGTLEYQHQLGLIYNFRNANNLFSTIEKILDRKKSDSNQEFILKQFIDPTALFIWFIEKYPYSAELLKKHPDYQLKFKPNIMQNTI